MNSSQPQSTASPAQTYEDYFVPGMFRPWAEELLARADPQPGEHVLDLACGTGIVARMVAQRLGGDDRVVGLDLSPAMIDVARATAEREGVTIAWHVGSADALPFADATFDLVIIQQGLQFFPDPGAALTEVHRVLTPGGRVATATWTAIANNPFHEAFAEAIHRHVGSPAMHTPFSLGDRDRLHSLFVDTGFDTVAVEKVGGPARYASPARFVDLGVASVAAAVPALQDMDQGDRAALAEALRADMEGPLRRYTQGDGLVTPMEAHIVLATKAA